MNNYVQPGKALTVTMPAAKTKGDGVQVGTKLFGVAVDTYTSGQEGVIWTEGVFDIAKTTGQAYAAGAAVWWNDTTGKLTSGTGANLEAGVVVSAAGSSDTTARIRLGAIPGVNT
jgi:predicted RecA/RadA family phage recombinase